MSDHSPVATTDLTSQYVAQVANDLERNAKEQERVSAEIAELQEQLAALRRDHALLVTMRQALDMAAAPAADAEPAPVTGSAEEGAAQPSEGAAAVSGQATVPAPRSRSSVTSGAEKPKTARKKGATGGTSRSAGTAKSGARSARKPATAKPAGKAPAGKAPRKANASAKAKAKAKAPEKAADKPSPQGDAPKLVDLVRAHLDAQKEPRSAAEVATALGEAPPGRTVKVTVVRSTLEGLVARNQAQRTKQGTSVFYTASDGGAPAPERAADAQS